MITDAQRYMANKAGADVDFAMTNNGGIRSDLTTRLANGQTKSHGRGSSRSAIW